MNPTDLPELSNPLGIWATTISPNFRETTCLETNDKYINLLAYNLLLLFISRSPA